MGVHEENHAGVVVRGWSGKIRPNQAEGGLCRACGEVVYIEAGTATGHTVIDRVVYVHHGCEPVSPSENFKNQIGAGNP